MDARTGFEEGSKGGYTGRSSGLSSAETEGSEVAEEVSDGSESCKGE